MAVSDEAAAVPHGTKEHAHEEHVEHSSPWPGLVGLSSGALALGLITTFSAPEMGMLWLILGTVAWLYTTTRWWTDVSAKAAYERGGLDPAESMEYKNFKRGMLFFIASEVFFFIAFFEHLFGVRIQTNVWPPQVGEYQILEESLKLLKEIWYGSGFTSTNLGHLVISPPVNTLILFLSGFTMRYGHFGIIRGNRKELAWWCLLTALMGSWFLGGQVYEYLHLPFAMKDGIFGTAFYVLTGFHGFHVFIGVTFIWVVLGRALAGHFTAERHFAVLAANWYWLFVDLIWLFIIFPVFYILPRFHW